MTIIQQIEEAETKDQLEAIGIEHLGVNADKRKGVETIRAELSELAEAQESDTAGEEVEPQEHADQQAEQVGQAEQAKAGTPAPEAKPAEPEKPAPDPKPEAKPAYKGRLLKHRKTGRLLPWTAQLAKKRDMQEV